MKDLEQNAELLRVGAWCYGCALHTHLDTTQAIDRPAYEYISQQAHFVRCFADDVAKFLYDHGVTEIDYLHLQYFFALEAPVYRPYMELWAYCYDRMREEDMLPTDAEQTLERLLSKRNENHQYLNVPQAVV